MRRLSCFAVAIAACYAAGAHACPSPLGDVTADGSVSVVDVQCVVLASLDSLGGQVPPAPQCLDGAVARADLNCDAHVDVTDVVTVIGQALGLTLSPQVDADANGCIDACDTVAPDALCVLSGSAGDVVACHLHVAPAGATATWLRIELSAPGATLEGIQDGVSCGGSGACTAWEIPPNSMLQSGHAVEWCPSDWPAWQGHGAVVFAGNTAVSGATSPEDSASESYLATLWWSLDADVPADQPLAVRLVGAQARDGNGTPLHVEVVDALMETTTLATACAVDGAPCETGEVCGAGACTAGVCVPVASPCDDGDPCTADTCDPVCGCTHVALPNCCGNGSCEPAAAEHCGSCPADCGACDSNCCSAHAAGGCDVASISTCVCAQDGFCCDALWDAACAWEAAANCGANCPPGCPGGAACPSCGDGWCGPGECGSCAVDCPSCADCCTPHPQGGCVDAGVQACACADDPTCCAVAWDDACVALAKAACGLSCPVCGDGACNGTEDCATCPTDCGLCTCGDGVCDATAGETCSTCPADCGACGLPCCLPHTEAGCDDTAVQTCTCALDTVCCAVLWDSVCVQKATTSCGLDCTGIQCGDGQCVAPEDCTLCPQDCGTCPTNCPDGVCSAGESCVSCPADCGPCTGACCSAHSGVGCDDGAVQSCVCGIDPACCALSWDAECAQRAQASCAAGCGP